MCHFLFLSRDWICIFASKTAGISWWFLSVCFSLEELFGLGVVLLGGSCMFVLVWGSFLFALLCSLFVFIHLWGFCCLFGWGFLILKGKTTTSTHRICRLQGNTIFSTFSLSLFLHFCLLFPTEEQTGSLQCAVGFTTIPLHTQHFKPLSQMFTFQQENLRSPFHLLFAPLKDPCVNGSVS